MDLYIISFSSFLLLMINFLISNYPTWPPAPLHQLIVLQQHRAALLLLPNSTISRSFYMLLFFISLTFTFSAAYVPLSGSFFCW